MNSAADLNTLADLSFYTKDALIEIAKRIPLSLGDYARKSKAEIRMAIEATDSDAVAAAIAQCQEEDIFEVAEDEPTPVHIPAPAAPAYIPHTPHTPRADAAAKLAEALRDLVPQAPLDRDEVMAMVDERIVQRAGEAAQQIESKLSGMLQGIQPKEVKVYVRPDLSEYRVPEGSSHASLDHVVKLSGLRQNILLVGPAGCGKTHLAEQAAQALGMEFSSISCTAGMSEAQLLGWLLPIGEGGRFEYVQSEFVRLYESGGVYLLDEIDAADANTLMILNQALANGGFYVPQARRMVKRHPDFVCIAAANTYGHGGDMVYAGRERLDGATLDRFRNGIVAMDYDDRVEEALIDGDVLTWGRNIRMRIDSLKLRRVMSTRALIGFTQQKQAYGWDREEWERSYFADWTREELAKLGR